MSVHPVSEELLDLLRIEPLDRESARRAQLRLDNLTKPVGSLGKLEALAVKLAGIYGDPRPVPGKKVVMVMAGDHGVARDGVSAYPPEVTAQMMQNFAAGGAAVNVLARHVGAEVIAADIGVATEIAGGGYERMNVRRGTRNMRLGPAMSRDEAVRSVFAGASLVSRQIDQGAQLIATGDMGIGNTTSSAAIVAAIAGIPARDITGRGTGINDEALLRKVSTIEEALAVNSPDPSDAIDILSKVGGLEIGAIAGVILGSARRRKPVIVDGFISTAAACLAQLFSPESRNYMIGSHLSAESGHKKALEVAGLEPLMSLDMRLGEGTGAALAMSFCDAALKIMNEMATFDEAGVSH